MSGQGDEFKTIQEVENSFISSIKMLACSAPVPLKRGESVTQSTLDPWELRAGPGPLGRQLLIADFPHLTFQP
jgi:hypothetical protein